jgi:predicted permease
MYWLERFRLQARMLFRRRHELDHLDAELRFHLDQQIAENKANGMGAEEARFAALRAFGNPASLRDQTHEAWLWNWLEAWARDLRYGVRRLVRTPIFTSTAILMMALGIGANTAVFSVMNALLMQWLPVNRPQGLFYVHEIKGQEVPPNAGDNGDANMVFSEPVFEALRNRTDVFEDLVAYVPLSFFGGVPVRHGELPETAEGEEVSGNFFSGIGVRMDRGRGFTLDDERNHAAVAVLSYDYWTRSFGRNPDTLGKTLYVKGVAMTVVGITAPGFEGIRPATATDFWVPLQNRPELNIWGIPASFGTLYGSPNIWSLMMMTRLRAGVTPEQARQAVAGTFGEAAKQGIGTIDTRQWKPLLDFVRARGIAGLNKQYREPVRILMGLVFSILLIACVNVAIMLQARNSARRREFGICLAIGAGSTSLFRQLLCESLLLVASGATIGWVLAMVCTRSLAKWSGIETGLAPDRTVLFFTLAVSCAVALALGLIPLRSAARIPVANALRLTASSVQEKPNHRWSSRAVLAGQVAICLVLLMTAGLLLRTLRNYAAQNLGMEAQHLLVFGITPQGSISEQSFYRNLLDRIRQTPGVDSVSMALVRPGMGDASNTHSFVLDGVVHNEYLRSNGIGPGFFHTLGVPILAGRDIGDLDWQNPQPAALVNETFVKRYFPNLNPLGHVVAGSLCRASIVGVVQDNKYATVDEAPMPMVYCAWMRAPFSPPMEIEVRTHGPALAMLPTLRKVVAGISPDLALEKPATQEAQFETTYQHQRMFAALGVLFGILAASLVATGLYGAHSFHVNRRTTEIGLRLSLGATRGQILIMILREGLWVLIAGLAMGVPLTVLAVHPLRSLLYQMSPLDPVSFALATVGMIFVAGIAVAIPARRAVSVEPMEALRME